jgi:TRAP-type C4-dicarboxylate transport system permease small subunit
MRYLRFVVDLCMIIFMVIVIIGGAILMGVFR